VVTKNLRGAVGIGSRARPLVRLASTVHCFGSEF